MKQTILLAITTLFIFLSSTSGFTQPVASPYAEDEVVIIFKEGITQPEIDEVLFEFSMHIEAGPTPYTRAYLLKFDSIPPPWAYLNSIDPINGIVERAQSQSSTDGAGLNYDIDQPVFNTTERPSETPPKLPCYSIFKEHDIITNGGNTVEVGIFDTGIRDVGLNFSTFFNPYELGFNYISPNDQPLDDNNHGTHISSILMDNLPNDNDVIAMSAYKTHNELGIGDVFDVIQALDESINQNVAVINMSFSFNAAHEHRFDSFSPVSIAIEEAKEIGGILCIASAGNENANNDDDNTLSAYPASYLNDNIISVASVGCEKRRSDWSNYGTSSVDIAAPGEEIWGYNIDGGFITMSGTSQATAFVTKVAILLATYQSTFDYALTKCAILQGVTPLTSPTGSFVASNGYINPKEALNALLSVRPCFYIPPSGGPIGTDRPNLRINASTSLEIKPQLIDGKSVFEISSNIDQTANVLISTIQGESLFVDKIELYIQPTVYEFDFPQRSELAFYFITIITENEIKTLKWKQ